MVSHHESAIAMAEVAAGRARAPEIRRLATTIRNTQRPEIRRMERIYQRLFGTRLFPNQAGHEALGLSADEAGMDHADAARMLDEVNPVERAFIDEMVPHHQGAIAMAKAILQRTEDAELKELARAIIDVQTREIAQMNEFRTKKYGNPVPLEEEDRGSAHGGEAMEGEH